MSLAITEDASPKSFFAIQRRIIDFANKVDDEDFTASLANLVDDDPARVKTKQNIQKHLQFLKVKKQMAELSPSANFSLPSSMKDMSQAAWTNLGSLNAGRISPKRFEDTILFIKSAARTLFKILPIL